MTVTTRPTMTRVEADELLTELLMSIYPGDYVSSDELHARAQVLAAERKLNRILTYTATYSFVQERVKSGLLIKSKTPECGNIVLLARPKDSLVVPLPELGGVRESAEIGRASCRERV